MKPALLTVQDIKSFIFKVAQPDERLTQSQVLSKFHLGLPTLKTYISMGLPWYGIKTRRQFVESEVKEWLAKNTEKISFMDILEMGEKNSIID